MRKDGESIMRSERIMNPDVFKNNLLSVLKEFPDHEMPMFRIIPAYDPTKPENGMDSVFRLAILGEKISNKWFDLDDAVEILTFHSPWVPTKIIVRFCGTKDGNTLFEIETSTRIRKPPQLANMETGHPPFQVEKEEFI